MTTATILHTVIQSAIQPGIREKGSALPPELLLRASAITWGRDFQVRPSMVLPTGVSELDDALPDHGLPRGQVIELAVGSLASLGLSVSLWACRAAQEHAALQGGAAWCAIVDPNEMLHAPGVDQAGVDLRKLLVVRPPTEALSRVVVRLAESRAFSVIVVDLVTASQATRDWHKVVRRLALAIEGTQAQVVLITDADASRARPLPVGLRLQLSRRTPGSLALAVTKERQGRVAGTKVITLGSALVSSTVVPTEQNHVREPAATDQGHVREPVAEALGSGLDNQAKGIRKAREVSPASIARAGSLRSSSLRSGSSHSGSGRRVSLSWKHPRRMRPQLDVLRNLAEEGADQLSLFRAV